MNLYPSRADVRPYHQRVWQPIDPPETASLAVDCSARSATPIVPHNNDALYVQDADCELQHGQVIGMLRRCEVGDVAVDKDPPGVHVHNPMGRRSAIGASDPEVLRRLQAFDSLLSTAAYTDGTFVREAFVAPRTLLAGSASWLALSPAQRFLYVIGGANHHVRILLRETLEVVDRIGQQGIFGGAPNAPHARAVDSKRNIYVGENLDGRHFQRFIYKGMGALTGKTRPPPKP